MISGCAVNAYFLKFLIYMYALYNKGPIQSYTAVTTYFIQFRAG